jgi:RNA polymerase sigma factor (TIGR02999 family)
MNEVTRVLEGIEAGTASADELLPLVYADLRKAAQAQLAAEQPGLTLDATALVHEAYLRLVGPANEAEFANRRHFYSAAAEAMRRILVERARRYGRIKHGGGRRRVEISEQHVPAPAANEDVLALDAALTRLALEDPIAAKVVELHHFAGLGHEQVAETLSLTVYRVRQKWTFARAWLRDALEK